MRLIYLLLSPTFGMHQYTADLANRLAAEPGMEVHLVTTAFLPRDRYSPAVRIHTPIATRGTGFSTEGLDLPALRRVLRAIDQIAEGRGPEGRPKHRQDDHELRHPPPDTLTPDTCIHLPAVHLWNLALVPALRRRGYRVIHTLHDLDPHVGVRFGPLIRLWNRLIVRWADRLLVHGQVYRQRLLAMGVAPERVVAVPLLHGFLSYAHSGLPAALADQAVACEPWALFFGRLERYKGVGTLLEAAVLAGQTGAGLRLVVAGQGELAAFWPGPLPPGVEVRPRRIDDAEAIDLLRRCGLLVLPYLDATQSALIAAAYAFRKPVIVTQSGALPEYVQEGVTGWVVPPGDAPALAATLQAALADPAHLAVMGAAGRQWYEAQRVHEYQTLLDLYRD
jgi:glycosyltransferase involved in cell wall biosynthesis